MSGKLTDRQRGLLIVAIIIGALVFTPAPIRPPHRLAESFEHRLGLEWPIAYTLAGFSLLLAFYFPLGVLASFAAQYPSSKRIKTWLKWLAPFIVILAATVIRGLKLGVVPLLHQAALPMAAVLLGSFLATLLLKRGVWVSIAAMVFVLLLGHWRIQRKSPSDLLDSTRERLIYLVESTDQLPAGEERLSAIVDAAFAQPDWNSRDADPVLENRAAILALGISLGHTRLAKAAGLDEPELVRRAGGLLKGTSLQGRNDWVRHYWLSAGLSVVQTPMLSDFAGTLKEQLDQLDGGSGFSFTDLAADRAGLAFGNRAARQNGNAFEMRRRLQEKGYVIDDFVPQIADLPDGLSDEAFKRDYGRAGSRRYRALTGEIRSRIEACPGLH